MIYDIWYMIYDIWYMIYDIWYDIIIYDYMYMYIYTLYDIYIWRLWRFINPRLDSRAGVLTLWFATRFHVRFYKTRTFQRMPTLKDIFKPTINEMLGDSRIAESFEIRKFMTAWGDLLIMACNERKKPWRQMKLGLSTTSGSSPPFNPDVYGVY